MKLAEEDSENKINLVPGIQGMSVPSACTIVIIAGFILIHTQTRIVKVIFTTVAGKYISKVDRVMTQVDKITEDIDHMPVAAFIFREKESDEVHFSAAIR